MSRILIKFPTRSRHQKALDVIKKYIEFADDISNIQILLSVDEDDSLEHYKAFHPCIHICVGPSLGKIGAINRDMPDPSTFDILLLASDDMIPIQKGYDQIIRRNMQENFPDGDGVLFFNDGYVEYKLNTLVICGSKYYQRFGYIYHPEYKSLFCDNEFTDVANYLGRQVYFDQTIIKHEHPHNDKAGFGFIKKKLDSLYRKNETFWDADKALYEQRKRKSYDLSVLICTISSRKNIFIELLNRITLLKQSSKLSIEVLFDSDEKITIGEKRNRLVNRALGTYCCFIDDDDKITDDYFSVIEESGLTQDCILLNGQMFADGREHKKFVHSIQYTRWVDNQPILYRNPNHLNPIKTSIVKQIGFPDKNIYEDRDFSKKLLDSGLLKTEYAHNKLQYLYLFVPAKSTSYFHVSVSNSFGFKI